MTMRHTDIKHVLCKAAIQNWLVLSAKDKLHLIVQCALSANQNWLVLSGRD